MKKFLLGFILLLGGCSTWSESSKTPLTPQGQMNVCIRDEVKRYKENGQLNTLGEWAAAQKIADFCTQKYNLQAMYQQAVVNTRNMMGANQHGTSLR